MWPWLTAVFGWVTRLVGGWLPIGTKPVSEWLGKLLWVIGVVMAINFVTDFFRPKPANTNAPSVIALPFSKVGNVDQKSEQKAEEAKRRWWQPIPYISVAGQGIMESDGQSSTGAKAEAGLRWDF